MHLIACSRATAIVVVSRLNYAWGKASTPRSREPLMHVNAGPRRIIGSSTFCRFTNLECDEAHPKLLQYRYCFVSETPRYTTTPSRVPMIKAMTTTSHLA